MQKDLALKNDTREIWIIGGPTASGKSGLALDLAQKHNGVVINADSMQVYKRIPILSAAPTAEDKCRAEHLLYEVFEPSQKGSVADWMKLAVEAVQDCWKREKLPIVVGGTGFYLESLMKGESPIPETSAEIKLLVKERLEKDGLNSLYNYLAEIDAEGAKKVNLNDTTRVRRAVEIFLSTGKSISYWFEMPLVKPLPEAKFKVTALLPTLDKLEDKCSQRFDLMMEQGALAEVEALLKLGLDNRLPAMKAIGVSELGAYLRDEISLKEAVDLSKLHTRQYAKRQLTWFRNRLKSVAEIVIE